MRDQRLNKLRQIKKADRYQGDYFFDPDVMKLWYTKVYSSAYPTYSEYGTLFITSEKLHKHATRLFTVRRAFWKVIEGKEYLEIESIPNFQYYETHSSAGVAAKLLQKEHLVPRDPE